MTVAELIARARVLLLDEVEPYRYSDAELLTALNDGLVEARRLRPDLFLYNHDAVPEYLVVNATEIELDSQYHYALMHFVVGNATMRDEEETNEARAGAFIQSFQAKLTGGAVA